MSLVDAHGNPVRSSLKDEEIRAGFTSIVNVLNELSTRTNVIATQQIYTGGVLEFIIRKLEEAGVLTIDEQELRKFLQESFEKIQQEASKLQSQADAMLGEE